MKYKALGHTDVEVSEICLGSMTWGTQNTDAEGHAQLDQAFDAGVNFVDTAEMYPTTPMSRETQGRSEDIIGSWLAARGRRDDAIIATKVTGEGSAAVRDGGPISPASIRAALDGSLQRLRTDYIDLYQLHWPNRGSFHFRQWWTYSAAAQVTDEVRDDLAETLGALGDEVKAGRIRHIGVSNDTVWGMMTMLRMADELRLPRIVSVQNEYSLLYRQFDTDLAEFAHHERVGLMAYSPIAAGMLSGKYRGGVVPKGSRADVSKANLGGRKTERAMHAVDAYAGVAEKHGLDLAQMSLAFCLSRPFMLAPIIGATTPQQLANALASADLRLSDEVHQDLTDVHRQVPAPY